MLLSVSNEPCFANASSECGVADHAQQGKAISISRVFGIISADRTSISWAQASEMAGAYRTCEVSG